MHTPQKTSKGKSRIENPETQATCGTQDEDKQSKNTTQYVGHHHTQANTNNVNK